WREISAIVFIPRSPIEPPAIWHRMRPRIIDPAVKGWSVVHYRHVVFQHHSAVSVCGVVTHIGCFVHNIDPLYHIPVVYDDGALQISLLWSGANQHTMVGPNRFHSASAAR